jgi:hypothetical protein
MSTIRRPGSDLRIGRKVRSYDEAVAESYGRVDAGGHGGAEEQGAGADPPHAQL